MDLQQKRQLNATRFLKVWLHVDEGIDIFSGGECRGPQVTILVIKVELSLNGL